jgi:hypothetical protein
MVGTWRQTTAAMPPETEAFPNADFCVFPFLVTRVESSPKQESHL